MIDQEIQRLLDKCKAVQPNPCTGCPAHNHAEKCRAVKSVDCKLERN